MNFSFPLANKAHPKIHQFHSLVDELIDLNRYLDKNCIFFTFLNLQNCKKKELFRETTGTFRLKILEL